MPNLLHNMKNINDIITQLSPERQEHIAERVAQITQEYIPDVWVLVEFSGTKVPKIYQRVLAGWYGGYLGGDSWKLSSGVADVVEHSTHYDIYNESGSVYRCYKTCEQLSNYTQNIYNLYAADNCEDYKMQVITLGTKDE